MTLFKIKPHKPMLTDLLIDSLWRIEGSESERLPREFEAAEAAEARTAQLGSSSVSQ